MASKTKRLIVIDSNSVIHRAFHALPPLTTKKGEQLGAVYGFLLVFFKAIKEFHPDFIVACFDFPAPTFRHKKFKQYKAKRPPSPKELYSQIPKVKEVLKTFNILVLEKEGFEADDIIGTVAKKFPQKQTFPKIETIILSGDLDTLQLVDAQTKVYLLNRGVKNTVLYNENSVKEKYSGLSPYQLTDLRALRGDASDNIPGVTGVGEKTAIHLLKEFGSLENLYKELEKKENELKNIKPRIKTLLIEQKEQAFLSQELARIHQNVATDFNPKKCQWKKYDKEKAAKILQDMEFYSLMKRLPNTDHTDGVKEENARELKLW